VVDIWFYQLGVTGLDRALPELLEKIVDNGWRAYVHCHDQAMIVHLDTHLWTFRQNSFLAHGTEDDRFASVQPILLGTEAQLVNSPDVYVSISPLEWPDLKSFKRALIIFDGHDDDHLNWARQAWKRLKAQAFSLSYWQQDGGGKWSKLM